MHRNFFISRLPGSALTVVELNSPRVAPLPIAYCLLPIAYCLLPIAYCLLPIAYCLLPTPYSLSYLPPP
ncbi:MULTISPECIES: hypothetical protein [unclassified Moorena]|uniref:hypothetical protein n=1 Tax=unclassified Moorena TaxID=2683338 RepID=UPI0013BC11FF|nr:MULTISPECIES: hypothetical protein [unclassified Moorena]NEQ04488.1 hypothetical protein [Moorena sp. SIO4E2]NER89212.1 hypothetical protein [Moorena sp. SIO3A2]NES43960.1 hypothetical protein [Moorena sp. SIO2C4]